MGLMKFMNNLPGRSTCELKVIGKL